jgi:hypothetical protein
VRTIFAILLAACANGRPAGAPGDAPTGHDPDGSSDPDGMMSHGDASSDAAPPMSPFEISWCPGGQITSDQVLSRFAPAATMATLASVTIDARKRQCQDQTGCLPWAATSSVPLFLIHWTGSGFTFINENDVAVPQTGTATCTVPGPNCSIAVGAVTTTIYPHDSANPSFLWGVSPRINGMQVQVGSWSSNPSGTYLEWGQVTTTNTCLFGTTSGRVYSTSGQYIEYQMVIYGQY